MHRRNAASWSAALAALVLLSGCLGFGPDAGGAFRDRSAPISATTRFDPDRMAGRWTVRARFTTADGVEGGQPESFTFGSAGEGIVPVRRDHVTCSDGDCVARREDLRAEIVAPGRYRMPRDGDGSADHWVLWTDADYRVAAIGTPSGAFGWIMTRGPARSDLMQAAREILDWNGYDLNRLKEVRE